MSTVSVLESLQKFCQERVTSGIKLQKPNDKNVKEYELVTPQVHIGWIPPKGYLPPEMESAIPCLIVGMDEASNESNEAGFNIRISAAVYSPGLHEPDGNGGLLYTPDFKGYHDLLNLIDKTVIELLRNKIINNYVTIQDPIKWGMYQHEQPYPYWYGWITFTARRKSNPPAEIIKDLL